MVVVDDDGTVNNFGQHLPLEIMVAMVGGRGWPTRIIMMLNSA